MKKCIQILVLMFVAQTIASCCKNVEFYDYSTMYVTESSLLVGIDENFGMTLFADDVQYMSIFRDFGFKETVAFDCDKGWGGMKHHIVEVSITSASDFDSTHASNVPLTDLFEYEVFLGEGQIEYRNLNELNDYSSDNLTLRLVARPSLELTHVFKVNVTKSNGEILEVGTKEITWQE